MQYAYLLAVFLCASNSAHSASVLDAGDEIDGMFVVPITGQPMLTMFIDENIASAEGKTKFDYKLNVYIEFVASKKVYERLLESDHDIPVRIALAFDHAPDEEEKAVALRAEERLKSMNMDVWLRVIDATTNKLVPLQP